MARKSKVETSPHFKEIVDLLLAGHDCRFVSDYLLNQYNEKISHTSICKYKREHLNVKAEARKKIHNKNKEKQQELKKENSRKKVESQLEEAVNNEVENQEYVEESLSSAADVYVKLYNRSDKFLSILPIDTIKEYVHKILNDPNIPLESKWNVITTIENLCVKHEKLQLDIYKDDTINVNVENNYDDFCTEEDILRFIDESDYLSR